MKLILIHFSLRNVIVFLIIKSEDWQLRYNYTNQIVFQYTNQIVFQKREAFKLQLINSITEES